MRKKSTGQDHTIESNLMNYVAVCLSYDLSNLEAEKSVLTIEKIRLRQALNQNNELLLLAKREAVLLLHNESLDKGKSFDKNLVLLS